MVLRLSKLVNRWLQWMKKSFSFSTPQVSEPSKAWALPVGIVFLEISGKKHQNVSAQLQRFFPQLQPTPTFPQKLQNHIDIQQFRPLRCFNGTFQICHLDILQIRSGGGSTIKLHPGKWTAKGPNQLRFGSDDFPHFNWAILRFHVKIFRGVIPGVQHGDDQPVECSHPLAQIVSLVMMNIEVPNIIDPGQLGVPLRVYPWYLLCST